MKRLGQVEEWHDRRIVPGTNWASEIDEHLDAAHLILLLVSADFIASDYCWGVELKRALERHMNGEARVIPILLRAVDWTNAPFSNIQALPTDSRPVTSWPNRDEAFADIAKGIRRVIEQLHQNFSRHLIQGRPETGKFQIPHLLPYLCDRSEQEIELGRSLRFHQTKMPRRPFLCFVHGDQNECHSEFLERLQRVTLPDLLNLKIRDLSVEDYTLPWPACLRSEHVIETFLSLLGLSLLSNSAASAKEIFDTIPHERPIMILLRLKTEDLTGNRLTMLSAFLNFWNEWPDLPIGRTLICVVSIRHQRFDKFGFFRNRHLRKTGEVVRRFISDLDFDAYRELCGVVLPELHAITHQDVVVWSQSKPVRGICHIREEAIDALFKRNALQSPSGHISMQVLADELELLITKYRR